jgi:hypothetical protein
LITTVLNFPVEFPNIRIIERKTASKKGIQDYTTTPDVGDPAVISDAGQNLWSPIMRRAAWRIGNVVFHPAGAAKVRDLNVVKFIEQEILWCEITMANSV